MTTEPKWRETLLDAARRDMEIRARLAASGELHATGYHPEMEAVHDANADTLEAAFSAIGWPGRTLVGDDGAAAVFLIIQHAIGRPDLQRRALAMLLDAIPVGEANVLDAAFLSDRIAVMEGRPQLFGTQLDWFDGALGPSPIEDAASVDARRASVGLPPLADSVADARARAAAEGETAPTDVADRRAAFEAWARKVGWRG